MFASFSHDFLVKGLALASIDRVELLRDTELVTNLERPEDATYAHGDAEAPQVLHIHICLLVVATSTVSTG